VLSAVSPGHRAPGAAAVSAALASLARGGEAPRIGLVGNTGGGKTEIARHIVKAYLAASPGFVFVVDAKAERRYDDLPGAVVRESVSHLANDWPTGARLIIIRPRIFEGSDADPEAIAALQWRCAGRRWPSLAVNDELVPHAADYGQWRRGSKMLKRSFIQGRTHGLTQLWGTTALQAVPIEAADQSSVIFTLQTAGLGLRLLNERNYLVGVPPGTVERLAGFERPPAERGEFLALRSGVPWDGYVYKF
jgi:hypothetical protein